MSIDPLWYLTKDGAVSAWVAAKDAFGKAVTTKRSDYYTLVERARYFDEVVEVWPEAERVRTRCNAAAIVVALDENVIERIRHDVAARAELVS